MNRLFFVLFFVVSQQWSFAQSRDYPVKLEISLQEKVLEVIAMKLANHLVEIKFDILAVQLKDGEPSSKKIKSLEMRANAIESELGVIFEKDRQIKKERLVSFSAAARQAYRGGKREKNSHSQLGGNSTEGERLNLHQKTKGNKKKRKKMPNQSSRVFQKEPWTERSEKRAANENLNEDHGGNFSEKVTKSELQQLRELLSLQKEMMEHSEREIMGLKQQLEILKSFSAEDSDGLKDPEHADKLPIGTVQQFQQNFISQEGVDPTSEIQND